MAASRGWSAVSSRLQWIECSRQMAAVDKRQQWAADSSGRVADGCSDQRIEADDRSEQQLDGGVLLLSRSDGECTMHSTAVW